MSENKKSGISGWASGLFGFLAGLFIGLVVLGWWLWPVQWSNGTSEILAPEAQEDFLRAAIDSYAYHPDDALAQQRYDSLGQNGPYTIGVISTEPGAQSATDIQTFAAAVGATEAIQNPPSEPAVSTIPELTRGRAITQPALAGLCAAAALILVALLIFLLLRRSSKKAAKAETIEAAPSPAVEEEAVSGDTAPIAVAAVAAAEQTEELPDWVQEAAPEGQEEIDLLGGEAEQSLTDEEIAEITSSRLSQADEREMMPDFLKEALPAAAVVGAGAVAVAALTGDEEAEGEPAVEAETAEELPLAESALVAEAAAEEAEEAVEIEETQAEAHAKFSQDIQTVIGIGPVYGEKLRQADIVSPLLLLRNGATAKGRQQIAEATGISERLILKWVNYVDLYRIKGVSEGQAELLEAAGVDTVPELSTRNPQNLHAKILEVIEQKRVFREPPALAEVQSWVAQAKKLPRAIHY